MHDREIRSNRPGTEKTAVKGCSCLLISLFGCLIIPILVYLSLVAVGGILIVSDPIVPVDAVVILSGDDGNRLAMAVDMYERGYVQNLVITNTDRSANRRLANEAKKAGFPEGSIYITDLKVDSTVDEARAVLQFARDKGWSAFMVVTDPYHSFRARFIFRQELRGNEISLSFRPVVGHWFRSPTWFFSREGWQVVTTEIIKFFGYLFLQF